MSVVVKKVGNFQPAPKINVILAGKKTEEVLFEALGFEFVKVNDSLKISCYDAYEESEDWGGGFLYGYTIVGVFSNIVFICINIITISLNCCCVFSNVGFISVNFRLIILTCGC